MQPMCQKDQMDLLLLLLLFVLFGGIVSLVAVLGTLLNLDVAVAFPFRKWRRIPKTLSIVHCQANSLGENPLRLCSIPRSSVLVIFQSSWRTLAGTDNAVESKFDRLLVSSHENFIVHGCGFGEDDLRSHFYNPRKTLAISMTLALSVNGVPADLFRDCQFRRPLTTCFQLRFVFGHALFFAGLVLFVRVECGRIARDIEGVRAVQVCGSQRDRGGVLDLDV